MLKKAKKQFYAAFLDPLDPENSVFTDASVQMVADNRADPARNLRKMIVAEIVYRGQRHEVWFNRQEILELSYWTKTPFKALAGAIKKRLLNLTSPTT
jgi:hypothetical protein